jgi:hypothetical protein
VLARSPLHGRLRLVRHMNPDSSKPLARECDCSCCAPGQMHCGATGCGYRPTTGGQLPDPKLTIGMIERELAAEREKLRKNHGPPMQERLAAERRKQASRGRARGAARNRRRVRR